MGRGIPGLLLAVLLAACRPVAAPEPFPTPIPYPVTPPPTQVQPTVSSGQRTLTVFAAASLTDAFSEISLNFEAVHPGVTVALDFAGAQTLSTQLIQGAVADIFASANKTEMDKLVAARLIDADAPEFFIANQLTVILPSANPGNVLSLQDLSRPGLKLDLTAGTVPAGKYALQLLDNMSKDPAYGAGFKTMVLANVVSYENDVKQVVAKVLLGEVDAGIVYASDSVADPELKTIEIPGYLNVVASYPIAALVNTSQPGLAAEFITYVLSAKGQALLKKSGFTPVVP